MAVSIGALTDIDIWEGQFQPAMPSVEVVGQAGVAGRAIIVGASNVEPVTIRTATYCTSAEAATLRTTAAALVGTVVSATDGYAQTRANTGVIACVQSVTRAKLPGSDTHIFQAVWTLLPEA